VKFRRAVRRLGRRALIIGTALGLAGTLTMLGLGIAFPFPAARLEEAGHGGSALLLDRDGGVIAWRVDSRENWRLPVSIDNVSPWLVMATVAAEDQRFFSHPGVDPAALARALGQNISGGRRVSGASTITMQAVRLLRPRRRTYTAKAVESFRAVQMELIVGKQEIIALYLNLAPYGGNVVGAEAAARLYFNKGAADLTLGEAALLAGVPQRPARFNPRRHLAAALRRREYVFRRMREREMITAAELAAARREVIILSGRQTRSEAARFADWIIAGRGTDCGAVRTTLAPEIQASVRAGLRRRSGELAALGIDGLAAVVIDVQRAELLAMVGSAAPDAPLSGQINAATSLRQPGSLLKPFIYARAFDSGILTPRSVVFDVPSTWRGYSPQNIDRKFRGPMSARRALTESRNLPAVRLLDRLAPQALARDMASLGIRVDSAVERCGLSLALGSAEVRLVEVANAYASLARMGEWRPLRTTQDAPGIEKRQVYSRGASYLTLRSLGGGDCGREPRLVWKTGTSWKHRDAWAVAMTPEHVVAVWCGRLSGEGHPQLVGARSALPIALELAEDLSGAETWRRPAAVQLRRVCALSGAPPGSYCPDTVSGEFLPGISSELPCRVHGTTGRGTGGRSVEVWPTEVASWLASRAVDGEGVPQRRIAKPKLTIISPRAGAEYVLTMSGLSSNALRLKAQAAPGTRQIYWFVDGEFLECSPPGRPVSWPLRPGRHLILASDGHDASAATTFSVIRALRGK
jgi:penicillin-binding protein 1C